MQRFLFILIACLLVISIQAQQITHTYNNVSLSEALLQLGEETSDFVINFLYDDLEDFLVTTTINHKSIPDAIQQMIGFYPVRMTVDTSDPKAQKIFVECIHRTDRHLTGTILDEEGRPMSYANVALLSPQDSTLLCGGVSNESGYFAIPYEQEQVLARVSYVGYKTIYRLCDKEHVGTIRMVPEAIVLNGVHVKGDLILSKAENGHLTYNMPMLLKVFPADDAYEALTHIPGVTDVNGNLTFSGQSVTLIINGKPTTLSAEKVADRLKSMPADMLAKAEVMPSAPPKYHVRGMAINIVTKDFMGTNQLSGQLQATYRQNKYSTANAGGSFIYNHGKFGMDASYAITDGTNCGKVEHEANHPLGDKRVAYKDRTRNRGQGVLHEYHVGMDYAFSEDHRLSMAYTGEWNSTKATNTTTGTARSVQRSHEHDYLHNVDASYTTPFGLQLGASYTNYQNPRTQNLDGEMYETRRDIYVNSRQKVGKWLFTADQTHTLSRGWELTYGAMMQFTNNNSFQTTRGGDGIEIPDASSHVDYDERILNGYVGFSKQIGPSLSLEGSVTAEQYHATKWNEWRIYPAFNTLWNVNPNNMLNLSVSSRAVYPNYWSTMSNIYYSSAYSEIWGNPDLKPLSQYSLDVIWQLKQRYTVHAFAVWEPDYFVQLAYQPSDRMAVIMKQTNFDFSNYYGVESSVRFSSGGWLNGTVSLTGLYRHDKSDQFFDLYFDRHRFSAILGADVSVKLLPKHNLLLMLNPFAQTKTIQGVYDIDALPFLNASLRWTSDNGKWSLIVKGTNIFNTYIYTSSRLANQDYAMRVWMNYANVTFSVVHRIGNFKEKKKKKVDTSRLGY